MEIVVNNKSTRLNTTTRNRNRKTKLEIKLDNLENKLNTYINKKEKEQGQVNWNTMVLLKTIMDIFKSKENISEEEFNQLTTKAHEDLVELHSKT